MELHMYCKYVAQRILHSFGFDKFCKNGHFMAVGRFPKAWHYDCYT